MTRRTFARGRGPGAFLLAAALAVLAGCGGEDAGPQDPSEVSCEDVPAAYAAWVASHRACEVDADCTVVGGTHSCACEHAPGAASGDAVALDGRDGAAALSDRFWSTECDAFRATTQQICDAAPAENVRCASGQCTADDASCLQGP